MNDRNYFPKPTLPLYSLFSEDLFNALSPRVQKPSRPFNMYSFSGNEAEEGVDYIEIPMPGLCKEHITVELDKGLLTIKGSAKPHEKSYHFYSVNVEAYETTIRLEADTEIGEVTYVNGVLTVETKKPQPQKPKVQTFTVK